MFRRRIEDSKDETIDTSTVTLPNASVSDDDSELQSCEWSPNNSQPASTTLSSLPSASPTPPPSAGTYDEIWWDCSDDAQFCSGNASRSTDLEGSISKEAMFTAPFSTSTPKRKQKHKSSLFAQPIRVSPRERKTPKRYSHEPIVAPLTCDEAEDKRGSTAEVEIAVPWKLTQVMNMDGCAEKCVACVHGLNEYDVLSAHHLFSGRTQHEQNNWVLEYFNSHCPCEMDGSKQFKKYAFLDQR